MESAPDESASGAEPVEQAAVRAEASGPRRIIATILIILTGLLTVVSLLAGYVRGDLLTTERYVQMVGPLARNPTIQAQVVDAVSDAVLDNVRLDDLTADALELLRARDDRFARLLDRDRRLAKALNEVLSGLGPLLQSQLDSATRRAAARVVQSPQFADLWVAANRSAHAATLAALRDQGRVLRTADGEVRIDVSVIVAEVKRRLIEGGFALADRIPVTDQRLVLVRSDELAKIQGALRLFDQIAPWVPWLTVAIAAAGVAAVPDRRRALQWLGVSLAVAMALTAVAIAAARRYFLDRVAVTSVDPAAAAAIADAALDPLWSRLIFVLVAAGLIGVVALLSGPASGVMRGWLNHLRSRGIRRGSAEAGQSPQRLR